MAPLYGDHTFQDVGPGHLTPEEATPNMTLVDSPLETRRVPMQVNGAIAGQGENQP